MLFKLVLCALLVAHAHNQEQEARVVNSPQGPVRGYKEDDIFVFHSIPYATAPTGVNKFRAPLDAPTWTHIFDALDSHVICPQTDAPPGILVLKTEQEDCLIATVYAPDTEENNLPVVIYVHGGGYVFGFGDLMQPRSLTRSQKIISVTFNYRLGIHGFLCLGTSGAPGNAGLKDILALLRWVNRNIASYGGNPDDVTIAGYSAGGSAVDLIMLSESATGLYNKVISDSGSNLAVFSVQLDPTQTAKDYARQQGFTNIDDIAALEEFYKTASWETLTPDGLLNQPDSTFTFVPCIERDIGEERVLVDAPINILKDGNYNRVPMLYGFTRMEGLFRIQLFDELSVRMNENFSDFLPADLQFNSEEQKEQVAQEVKEFYFGNQPVNVDTIFSYIDYFTDSIFAYPMLRSVGLQVEAGNDDVYLYHFSFTAEEIPSALENVDVSGPDHIAQTMTVLDFMPFNTERSLQFQEIMREMWLNFMTTGTPVPDGSSLPVWPPVGTNRNPHMYLNETPQLEGALIQGRAQFWDSIYDRHYRKPVPPIPPEPGNTRLVQTPQGSVVGYREDDIIVFHSIPYATAPTGANRFKAPLPAPTWTEPFEALDFGIICPQVGAGPELIFFNKTEQEDCLKATVYVPDTQQSSQLLPVVVYVHGGAYQQGWGNGLSPRTLTSSGKIIGITFNYRLGIHGFLCLGTAGAPGNAGLKDIVALLRWVRTNIAGYGGNPDDVTIAGFSAGASAVDLVMISETANGLFHKVIPDSGANVAVWSVQLDPIDTARNYALRHNFTNVNDIEALEEFYTTSSMDRLILDKFLDRPNSSLGFVPCVELDIGEERFLIDAPVNILKEGNYYKVPMLYGFTEMEGLFRINFFNEWSVRMNEKFSDFLPADLQFSSEEQKEQVAQDVKQFYFGHQSVNENTVLKYINYFTDIMFAFPTLRAVKLHVEAGNNNIYLYEYTFTAEEFQSALENIDVRGADHAAQSFIVLDFILSNFTSTRSLDFQVIMRELWLNFITTGSPVSQGSSLPAWPPVGVERSPHMNLDSPPQLGGPLLQLRMELWDNIYERHYRAPVGPSSPSLVIIQISDYINPVQALVFFIIFIVVVIYINYYMTYGK